MLTKKLKNIWLVKSHIFWLNWPALDSWGGRHILERLIKFIASKLLASKLLGLFKKHERAAIFLAVKYAEPSKNNFLGPYITLSLRKPVHAAIFWAVNYAEHSKNEFVQQFFTPFSTSCLEKVCAAIFWAVNYTEPMKNKCARHFPDYRWHQPIKNAVVSAS